MHTPNDPDWDSSYVALHRLELKVRFAHARQEVAARLAWFIAFWAGAAIQMKWDSWPAALAFAAASYLIAAYPFTHDLKRAKAEYTAHTGQQPDFM